MTGLYCALFALCSRSSAHIHCFRAQWNGDNEREGRRAQFLRGQKTQQNRQQQSHKCARVRSTSWADTTTLFSDARWLYPNFMTRLGLCDSRFAWFRVNYCAHPSDSGQANTNLYPDSRIPRVTHPNCQVCPWCKKSWDRAGQDSQNHQWQFVRIVTP